MLIDIPRNTEHLTQWVCWKLVKKANCACSAEIRQTVNKDSRKEREAVNQTG